MAVGYTELFLEQGATFNTSITIDDISGLPFDLAGFTGSSQMRKSYYSSTAAAEFTVTTGPDAGVINLALTSAATANIASGRYLYDVYISNGDIRTRVLEGIVNVTPQVTKAPGML